METTSNKIEKALEIMNNQDFYWKMADYATKAYNNAYCTMRAFVELVATIEDSAIVKALRELWVVSYNCAQAAMMGRTVSAEYKAKESELMAVIKPYIAMAA